MIISFEKQKEKIDLYKKIKKQLLSQETKQEYRRDYLLTEGYKYIGHLESGLVYLDHSPKDSTGCEEVPPYDLSCYLHVKKYLKEKHSLFMVYEDRFMAKVLTKEKEQSTGNVNYVPLFIGYGKSPESALEDLNNAFKRAKIKSKIYKIGGMYER